MTENTNYYDVVEATWPPARRFRLGPWTIRDGQGGGKRVSAATAEADFTAADLPAAEAAMRDLGQPPLFMIRVGEKALDQMLADAGYQVIDPVTIYEAPIETMAIEPPPITSFTIWPPLKIMLELWDEGGIGPARIAVMDRADCVKTGILGRARDRAAGCAYIGIHGRTAMVHALEVHPTQRRQNAARNMMMRAACWAKENGAETLALVVTDANDAANALYTSMGMHVVGQYHYRIKPAE